MKKLNVKEIALIGILGGMAGVLMLFRTPIPFMPPFMDFDLAALPEIIGGFALGPIAAVCIVLVKILVKLALVGTNSMFTGEICNVILSLAYVLPAVLIYNHHKSKKSALYGMLIGSLICAVAAVFTNVVIIIPFYVNLYGMSVNDIIMMCQAVNPYVTDMIMLAIFGIIPFNLIKCAAASFITMLLYKKISPLMKNFVKG